jgi:hypothetical protein
MDMMHSAQLRAFAEGLAEGRRVDGSAVSCRLDHQDRRAERRAWFDGFSLGRSEVQALVGEPD